MPGSYSQRLEVLLQMPGKQLAMDMGVTEGTISRWRHGQPISLQHFVQLCEHLEVSADWLLWGRSYGASSHAAAAPLVVWGEP